MQPPDKSCHKHPHALATDQCESCHVAICEYCVTPLGSGFYCRPCAQAKRTKKRLLLGGVVLGVLGLIGLVGWLAAGAIQFVDTDRMAKGQRVTRAGDEGRRELEIAADPCNRKLIRPWVTSYPNGDCSKVLPRAQFYFDRCGPFLRLRWSTYACHRERGDYDRAIADVTRLIRNWPHDKDFRWWRGELYAAKKDWTRALDDYWQAVLLSPAMRRVPFDLELQARHAGQHCRAVFPMLQHAHYHKGYMLTSRDRKIRQKAMRYCRDTLGSGAAGGPTSAGRDAPPVVVRLNGKVSGEFALDLQTGLTLISRELADKLGLKRGKPFLGWHGEQLQSGHLVVLDKVSWGGAEAKKVEALVIDGPAFFTDGVLGRTFLLRFNVRHDEHRGWLTLSSKTFPDLNPPTPANGDEDL